MDCSICTFALLLLTLRVASCDIFGSAGYMLRFSAAEIVPNELFNAQRMDNDQTTDQTKAFDSIAMWTTKCGNSAFADIRNFTVEAWYQYRASYSAGTKGLLPVFVSLPI